MQTASVERFEARSPGRFAPRAGGPSDRDPRQRRPWSLLARTPRLRLPRGGLVVHSVLLSMLLVVATALAVGTVVLQALSRQAEQAADQRLRDGASLFESLMDATREDLTAVGTWLASDPEFVA